MKKTLVIGCGNIGFRHLQALCSTTMIKYMELVIVEPNVKHHQRILDELSNSNKGHDTRLLTALPRKREHFDLVVIATNADVRARVFHDLADNHDYDAILFEKVLFQRTADLDAVARKLDGVKAYVNCGRRGFPGYQMLRSKLDGRVDCSVCGNQFALASNAIHFLDIVSFLNTSPLVSINTSALEPSSTASKRSGYVEIYGTLTGVLENGAEISLTCKPADRLSFEMEFTGEWGNCQIYEAKDKAVFNGETLPFQTRNVSEMPYIYETLLQGASCLLPTYGESAEQHRILLRAINAHLRLPDSPETLCPIS